MYSGIVFTVADEDMANTLAEAVKTSETPSFEDGASNLRAVI